MPASRFLYLHRGTEGLLWLLWADPGGNISTVALRSAALGFGQLTRDSADDSDTEHGLDAQQQHSEGCSGLRVLRREQSPEKPCGFPDGTERASHAPACQPQRALLGIDRGGPVR